MKTLFIDTSSSDVSIAVVENKKVLSCIVETIPNSHSIYTVSFLSEVLKEARVGVSNIDKILVVNGPGSFTGVRIGVTIAKTYAYLKNIPVVGVSALRTLALSCEHNYCLAIINARNDNYYIGLYDKNNEVIIDEQFNNKDFVIELIKRYNPTIVCNETLSIDGLEINKMKLDFVEIVTYYNNEDSVNCHLLVPNYLKLPQALEGKK